MLVKNCKIIDKDGKDTYWLDVFYPEFEYLEIEASLNKIKPIPLTEDLLFKFGFEQSQSGSYCKKYITLYLQDNLFCQS